MRAGRGGGGELPSVTESRVTGSCSKGVVVVIVVDGSKQVEVISHRSLGPGFHRANTAARVEGVGVGLPGPVVGWTDEPARVEGWVVVEEDGAADYAGAGGEVGGAVGADALFAHFGGLFVVGREVSGSGEGVF